MVGEAVGMYWVPFVGMYWVPFVGQMGAGSVNLLGRPLMQDNVFVEPCNMPSNYGSPNNKLCIFYKNMDCLLQSILKLVLDTRV